MMSQSNFQILNLPNHQNISKHPTNPTNPTDPSDRACPHLEALNPLRHAWPEDFSSRFCLPWGKPWFNCDDWQWGTPGIMFLHFPASVVLQKGIKIARSQKILRNFGQFKNNNFELQEIQPSFQHHQIW